MYSQGVRYIRQYSADGLMSVTAKVRTLPIFIFGKNLPEVLKYQILKKIRTEYFLQIKMPRNA